MKNYKILPVIIFFTCTSALAQQDTMIGNPPGYLNTQYFGMNGMAIDNSNIVWLAYSQIGLAKFNGNSWTVYDSLNSPLLKNKILSVACNIAGVWAGTDTGLFNFTGATWNWYNTSNSGIPTDTISKLYSKGGNDLYIYSTTGFVHYNGITWQEYNTGNSGLVNDTVQCLFKDAAGTLWIGTRNGLSRFDGNTWQNFTTANSDLPDNDIHSLTEDGNQHLFVGTLVYRALVLSGGSFYSVADSISNLYNFPLLVSNLYTLSNGSVLLSSHQDMLIETDPIAFTARSQGFYASDTNNISAIDQFDRIWKYRVHMAQPRLWMRDSVYQYPVVTGIPPSSYGELDVNQVRCGMFNNNSFHWDLIGTAKYEVPRGSGKSPVFGSALWIGALDSAGSLHMSAQTYMQSGDDFWPGPLDTTNASIDLVTLQNYDSIWKVNRSTVNEFIVQFALGNVTNGSYTVPDEILFWPAHGAGNYPASLAPFVDTDADGIYNPMAGDYPDIRGDQMLWWVMNDNFDIHRESGGIALGLEIRCKAYAYYCPNIADSNEAVNYTTFYSFDIINRSDSDYHDAYIGLYVDIDLGNYLDDYVGCNVDHDIGFAYNGDNTDEGITGYGLNPPMLSSAILKGPLAEPGDTIDNNHDGIIDEPGERCMMNHFLTYSNNNDPASGNPNGPLDFYYYLRSIWRNGVPMPADYLYPGTPYDTGWTETSAGNLPDDRRFLMSSGPFSLRKGETRTIDYAYIFSRDESAPNGLNTSIAKNLADVERIKRWFETDSFPCNNSSIGISEIEKRYFDFTLYPNPGKGQLAISSWQLPISTVEIYDPLGRKIFTRSYTIPRHELSLNTSGFSSGIYFVKVSDGKKIAVKKLVIE